MIRLLALAAGMYGSSADAARDPMAGLWDLRAALDTQTFVQDVSVDDRRPGGASRTATGRSHVTYSRAVGKVRRDVLEIRPGSTSYRQDGPEPQWLFRLVTIPAGSRTRTVPRGAGSLVEVRHKGQGRPGPARTIELNAAGLPVAVRTFGARGGVLDELTIRWQRVDGKAFPAEAILVQASRLNTVTTTVRFTSVRLNRPVSATLFIP